MHNRASNALLILLLVAPLGCGTNTAPSHFDSTPTTTSSNDSHTPLKTHTAGAVTGDANCIVVLLHGYGAPGTDLVALADVFTFAGEPAYIFPEAPIELPEGGRAWFQTDGTHFNEAVSQVKHLLAELADAHPNCPIVVGGFSQGATIASNVLDNSRCPTLQAAVLFSPANYLKHPPQQVGSLPKVLIAHGRNDPILPFSDAEALHEALSELGCETSWAPFDGTHTISPEGIRAAEDFIQDFVATQG